MKPIDNQQNFQSVEIFNAQISESFSRTENEVTQETKFFSFAAVRSLLLSLLSDKTGNSLSNVREAEKKRDSN